MKLKRFTDGEAIITELEEGRTNENELLRDELGRAKRSTDAAGMRPSGMLGTIHALDERWGVLKIAPGTLTHAQRVAWLLRPQDYVGKVVHWRSFGYGVKDKPRFPRCYGLREDV